MRAPGDGLQAERTALSWSRTSLGFLSNGVLLLLRDAPHHTAPIRLVPAALFMVLAVAVHLVARYRRRVLARRPLRRPLAARRPVLSIGWSMAALVVITAAVLISR
jgi:uncharacterized membrane protein YidH (DUF202 family)